MTTLVHATASGDIALAVVFVSAMAALGFMVWVVNRRD